MNMQKVIVSVLCLSGLFLAQCTSSKTLPPDISGRWSTDSQAYKGEFIEISSDYINFGTEDGEAFTYTVQKVKKEKGHLYNSTQYKVHCTDNSGVVSIFTFIFTPEEGGTLRQKSTQDILWKRTSTGPK